MFLAAQIWVYVVAGLQLLDSDHLGSRFDVSLD